MDGNEVQKFADILGIVDPSKDIIVSWGPIVAGSDRDLAQMTFVEAMRNLDSASFFPNAEAILGSAPTCKAARGVDCDPYEHLLFKFLQDPRFNPDNPRVDYFDGGFVFAPGGEFGIGGLTTAIVLRYRF